MAKVIRPRWRAAGVAGFGPHAIGGFDCADPTSQRQGPAVASDLQYSSEMAIRPELRCELLTLSQEDRHELADEFYESLIAEPIEPA